MKKKILIAIPTAKYIEADTFKSVFDAAKHVDKDRYEVHFQTFFGYNISQIRNLIADWVIRGYDYLFSVDSDITFPEHTLTNFLERDCDIVTGIYRQRVPEQHLEIYDLNLARMFLVPDGPLFEIGACGMGCALIKKEVLLSVPYPQYEYHNALDHNQTFSEDIDFCVKARNNGAIIYADSTILCGHIGSTYFNVQLNKEPTTFEKPIPTPDPVLERFRELRSNNTIPESHVNGLNRLKKSGFRPKVILDVGACVLHWYDHAKSIWPDSEIIPIEAMSEVTDLYDEAGIKNYATGTLISDINGLEIQFYKNTYHPGGNSYLKENPLYSPGATELFPESSKVLMKSKTIDSLISHCKWPQPDFIKMDIQGAEYAALQGAREALNHAQWVLLELQHVDYNMGAPQVSEVINFMHSQGFRLDDIFGGSELGVDRDYLFTRY